MLHLLVQAEPLPGMREMREEETELVLDGVGFQELLPLGYLKR